MSIFPTQVNLPAFADIEQVLDSIAVTGSDIQPYLSLWSEEQRRPADLHLLQFVTWNGSDFANGGTLSDGFWEQSGEAAKTLRRWLLMQRTLERIIRNADSLPADGFEHLFPPALEILLGEAEER